MQPQTFIFTGLPGSGKGTQARLLQKYVAKQDPDTPHFDLATGDAFREFVQGDSYTQRRAKEVQESGALQPQFLAIWMWSDAFIKRLEGGEHMFIDGFPRIMSEAYAFDSAMEFYQRAKPYVFYVDVDKEESKQRLRERLHTQNRGDDVEEKVKKRFRWHDELVVPVIDFFRENERYTFLAIDGEQSIEEVHDDIIQALN